MDQLVKTEKGRQAPYGDITPQPVRHEARICNICQHREFNILIVT